MLASSKKFGSLVVPRVDVFTLSVTDESYLNMYEGYVSVDETGYYLFGCEKVDNAFMMEIDGHRAFEFWANATWNDDGSQAWMPETSAIYMEAGKTYSFKAAFAEFNGGQALWPRLKYSADGTNYGEAKEMNAALNYTTDLPTDNDQVDAAVLTGEGVTLLNNKIKLDSVAHDMGDLWQLDGPITNIFDNDKTTKFGASGKWDGATITWETTEPITVSHYKIVAANDNNENPRIPVAWVFLGSNDGKNYTIIDKVGRGHGGIAALDFAEAVFEVDNPAAYNYYKLQVVSTWAGGGDQDVAMSFADFSLYNVPKTQTPPTTPPTTGEVEYEYKEIEYTVAGIEDSDERAAQSNLIGTGVFWRDQNWEGSEVTFTKSEVNGNKVDLSFTHTGSNSFGAQFFYNPAGTENGTTYKVVLKVTASVTTSITVNGTVYDLVAGEESEIEYLVTADMHPENTEYQYGTSVVAIQFGVKDPFKDIVDGDYSIVIDSIAVQSVKTTPPAPPTGSAALVIAAVAVVSLAGVAVVAKKREQD